MGAKWGSGESSRESFTIDQIGWHTSVPGNPESREEVEARFRAIAEWLQVRGLTTKTLLHSPDELTDDFSIGSEDLTDLGLEVMRKAYSRWVDATGRGRPVSDVSIMERALQRVRRLQ
jgi:hypothetical protein